MIVVYRPAALHDLRGLVDYLSVTLKNPKAGARLSARVLHSISHLKQHPNLGRKLCDVAEGCDVGIRYLIVEHQLVFYKVDGTTVEVLRILDGRTDYLTHLFEE